MGGDSKRLAVDRYEGVTLAGEKEAAELAHSTRVSKKLKKNRGPTFWAVGIEVHCPHCGEPLCNLRDESLVWTTEDFDLQPKGKTVCNSCDEEYTFSGRPSTTHVGYDPRCS